MSQHTPPSPVKKGKELILDITTAAFEGKGLGKVGEYAVFVKNTAPGDRVRVRINRKRKNYAEGVLLELLEPSPIRISPKCRHAGTCGGCTWQHIPYEKELVYKSGHVKDHFQRIGGFRDISTEPVIGAPEPFYYRNKMEYTFGDRRWLTDEEVQSGRDIADRDFALGLHVPGRYDRILNLEECHLQDPVSFRILDAVREYALANNIPPYNTHRHEGFLRNLIIRNAEHTGDLMVNLVTSGENDEIMQPFSSWLLERFPEITTVIHTINDTRSPSSEGRYQKVLYGPGYIREYLGPYHFRIDPNTFFQTNTHQARALYDVVLGALDKVPVLYDLYCGVGTLSVYLSGMATRVVGVEVHAGAVEKARENAAENGVSHAVFEQGDMKDIFNDDMIRRHGSPDIIVTDPPRAGMHESVIRQIISILPKKIIYVSCNSSTQARDVALLSEYYRLERIQPVDMFPRTYHIESVAVLSRNDT
ncbi:MAG: 23S rRNA (uracil(1939)-C(5))-methyltransferase RlmD [Balneolaceae bacterium]|nr:MAG: 23S rRNA (uracil(1939)-C(5))-methyltransferase RlmD [Balneolaceae bacterium]